MASNMKIKKKSSEKTFDIWYAPRQEDNKK